MMKISILLSVLFFAFAIIALSNTALASTNKTDDSVTPEEKVLTAVQKWKIIEMELKKTVSGLVKSMLPQVLRASEDLKLSSKCSRSMMKFMTGLKQLKDFAFQMFDASGKIPNGLYSGSINSFGDYDSCIDTVVPGHFQGQYCTLDVRPPIPPRKRFVSYDIPLPDFINITSKDSAMSTFIKHARYYYFVNYRSSICMPSTCSREEIEAIASKVLDMAGLPIDVFVPNCEIKVDKIVLDETETGIAIVIAIFVSIALIATIADVFLKLSSNEESYQENLNKALKYLLCFSLYTNFRKLMRVDDNPDSIKIIHGMKAITILWVMLSHNYFYQNFQAMCVLLEVREKGREYFFQLVSNGVLSVETFFFISAVLVSYGVTKIKGKRINIFLFVFRRLWRLTPPLIFVIGITILLPHFGSGPVWKETVVDGLTSNCRKNWWTNLLYISNFIPYADMCLNWSWYIPVDFQLYLLSLLVIIPLQRNPRLAFVINGILFLIGIIISAALHVYYQLAPLGIYVYMHPDDYQYFVDRGYFRSYLHIPTYSIGLYVGYLIATNRKIKIPLVANIFGWIAAFVLGLGVTFGTYWWNQGFLPNMFVSALFGSTNKMVFSLGLAYVVIACMSGNGDIATTILSWNGFIPLSRLTYMTYLIHPLIHFTYIGSTRVPIAAEHRTLIHQYWGTVVLSFISACFASLLFETPFMALEKVFFSSQRRKQDSDNESEEVKDTNLKIDPSLYHNRNGCNGDLGIYAVNFKKIGQEN